MYTTDQDSLTLWRQYGDLYNEIVRPERKYTISHYLRTQWAPLLGAARLWFVIALRQRCFWNQKQDWCVVDKKTLARESGLSLRTVNRIISASDTPATEDDRDTLTTSFFGKTRRRRYNQRLGRTVNAPNRYHVLLDDPLTPNDQAALAHYLGQQTADGSPEDTLRVLQDLCARRDIELDEILSPAVDSSSHAAFCSAAFAFDVVLANCPMPAQEDTLYVEIAKAASRLHNAITRPERVHVGNQYFRLQWLSDLGPALALLIIDLRARCYWNERTGELRDTCQASWAELAGEIGCTSRQLRNLRQKPLLSQFLDTLHEGRGRARSTFRVQMVDPLTTADHARFEMQLQAGETVQLDPETGQLDAYPLIAQATAAARTRIQTTENTEIVAPSADLKAEVLTQRSEIMAHRDRKLWHIEGLNAEILTPEPGNYGTTKKVQLITPTSKGLREATLDFSSELLEDNLLLAASLLDYLLAQLDIQEPNRSKLCAQHPPCDWTVTWGLYTLTQPGLSENKAGYVYRRLLARDPPPADFLTIAILPPSTWRLFQRALTRYQERLIPEALRGDYDLWKRLLSPVWDDLVIDLGPADETPETEGMAKRQQGPWVQDISQEQVGLVQSAGEIPREIRELLSGSAEVYETERGWRIVERDLYQAYCLLTSVVELGKKEQIEVCFEGFSGREYTLNAEILALEIVPCTRDAVRLIPQELSWLMPPELYRHWWRDVLPVGLFSFNAQDRPCVVIGVPAEDVKDWIVSRQMTLLQQVCDNVLEQVVDVALVVYALPEPVPSLAD